jgi:hypothetical protein
VERWDNCKMIKSIYFTEHRNAIITFEFLFPDNPWIDDWVVFSNPIVLSYTPLYTIDQDDETYGDWPIPPYGRYSSFQFRIMNEKWYHDPLRATWTGSREWVEDYIIWTNNKYYFLIWRDYVYIEWWYGIIWEDDVYHINIFDV